MRQSISFAAIVIAAGFAASPVMSQAAPVDIEKAFDAAIDPAEMGAWMKKMAAEPNHVGAPHNKANAEDTLARFKAWCAR